MNLLEAVKSGKPFKRPGWSNFISYITNREIVEFSKDCLLADDYVLQHAAFRGVGSSDDRVEISSEAFKASWVKIGAQAINLDLVERIAVIDKDGESALQVGFDSGSEIIYKDSQDEIDAIYKKIIDILEAKYI